MKAPRVVVVGAGVSGLSCAATLLDEARRAGAPLSLTVLEASTMPGGHAQTVHDDGFVVEAGPNGFLDREPQTMALVAELGLQSRLVEARPESARRFIVRRRRLCRVPDGPLSLLATPALSTAAKLRLAAEPFVAARRTGDDETVQAFASRRIGAEAAEMLVDAAVSGISAGDSRRLSLRAQFPMMHEMEREHGSLVRAMFARRRSGRTPARLRSFDGGMGVLTSALATAVAPHLRTGSAVREIGRDARGWRLTLGTGEIVEADHVVLAVAARIAAPLVAPLDAVLGDALGAIDYAGLAVVALGFPAAAMPRPLDGYGYLTTRGEGLATLGVVWESSLFPGRAPDGAVLLRVMLGGSRRPDILALREAHIVDLARQELQAVMGITTAPSHVWAFSWPEAIAQYTVGHLERRAAIAERQRAHRGLTLCGTSYDGVSFNHAVKSGREAATALGARLWPGRVAASVPAEGVTA